MSSPVKYSKSQLAPCGMNCGTCIAFLREKNKCYGCRIPHTGKLKTRQLCIIKNCENLSHTSSGFCYDCKTFPCKRVQNLDKRYRTKYNTGLIENLNLIKETGIEKFLLFEAKRRTCPKCGSGLSVHRKYCLACDHELN